MLRPARVGLPAVGLLSTGTHAAVGAGLLALSIVSLGMPATLLLAGGWLLAAGCHRLVPGLDGPVSWAAGVVLEVAIVCTGSGVLGLLSGREHGQLPNTLVLLLPVVLGAAALAFATWRDRTLVRARTGSRHLVAATVTAAGLIVPMWIASHGVNFRVAWAMSGDSRNHVLIMRQILHAGGLTVSELRGYPAVFDAVASVLSAAGDRSGLAPGQLMLHDAHALVAIYVGSGIALATLTVAALLELLPRATAALRRLPLAVLAIVLLASTVSVSALVLGTSLQDGYVTSYATVPLALASLVLAIRCCAQPSPAAFALLGPAAILVFFSMTLLSLGPMVFVAVAATVHVVRARRGGAPWLTRTWVLAVVVSGGAVVALVGVVLTHVSLLHTQFIATGTITAPQPHVLWLLGFLAVGLLATARPEHRWQLLVPVVFAVAAGLTVKFLVWLSPDGKAWTYYGWKTLYLSAACLLWLAFLPALLAVTGREPATEYGRLSGAARTVAGAAASLAVLALMPWTTTLTSPLDKAKTGWTQPSAGIVTEVARVADRGQPFMLWHWSDPGNERLGEFWAATAWAYNPDQSAKVYGKTLPNGFPYWAYFEGSTPKDLCDVTRAVDGIDVITLDPKVKAELTTTCPNSGAHVFVEKPAGK